MAAAELPFPILNRTFKAQILTAVQLKLLILDVRNAIGTLHMPGFTPLQLSVQGLQFSVVLRSSCILFHLFHLLHSVWKMAM